MTIKTFYLLCFGLLCSLMAHAQLKTYSFEEMEQQMRKEARPVIVFIYTDWCKFCKIMQKRTFQDEEVVTKLNESFYFIWLDAEQKEPVSFRGATFRFIPSGNNTGLHELAWQLGEIDGTIGYPTLTLLNSNYEIVFQKSDVLRPKAMLQLLEAALLAD